MKLPSLDQLRGVFEHSPWVAERAWLHGPFGDLGALHAAMMNVVREAPREQQLALVRAHPELAGREAAQGDLTPSSAGEQGRLGFTRLSKAEFERMAQLNRAYREKFGFPCIVALKLHENRGSVMQEIERRIGNDAQTELAGAIEQIGHITRGRLERLCG